jgi:hypothetical protein
MSIYRRVTRSLHAKDLFCRFREIVCALQPLQKTTFYVPTLMILSGRYMLIHWNVRRVSENFNEVMMLSALSYPSIVVEIMSIYMHNLNTSHREGSPIHHVGTRWVALWVWVLDTYTIAPRQHVRSRQDHTQECSWWRGVLDAKLCDKVCQWLVTSRWFSLGTPGASPDGG